MTEGAFFANGMVTKEIEAAERRLFYVAITRAVEKLTIIAGTDMIKLQRWFELNKSGYPGSLKKHNSVRFLYESQLKRCQQALGAHTENIRMT